MKNISAPDFARLLAQVYAQARKSNPLPELTELRGQQLLLLSARYLRLPLADEFKNTDKKPHHPDLFCHDWADTHYNYRCENPEDGTRLTAVVQKVVNEQGKHNAVKLRYVLNSQ